MADDWAIRVNGLGKRYSIAADRGRYTSLRDVLSQGAFGAARRLLGRGGGTPSREPFWALRDVSFEVPRGECVGVIGRNGAGKSTLLKVLSRITEPTEGEVDLRGRVGSLLEVGTGFHPELTGRENVFLNGAILGMTRREIARKFDEIAAFAEVERFLDTPVKHYSSGMYTRLAFAVAAHLEPEILIVDEVLAVGDAEFQRKCLGKMGEVARGGRTVLFVSHNISAISSLCSSCIVLADGRKVAAGETGESIKKYLSSIRSRNHRNVASRFKATQEWYISSLDIIKLQIDCKDAIYINVGCQKDDANKATAYLSVHIVNSEGSIVTQCDSRLSGFWLRPEDNDVTAGLRIVGFWLKPGSYNVDVFVCSSVGVLDRIENAGSFEVSPRLPYSHTSTPDGIAAALVLSDFQWSYGGVDQ